MADTVDTVEADTVDMVEEHMVEVDAAVIIVVDDVVLLPRRHNMEPFLQPVVKLPHSLEGVSQERDPRQYQILSNGTIIGIIVTHVGLTSRIGILLRHSPRIGVRRDIKRGVLTIMYNSTLLPVIRQKCRDSIRISCLWGSDMVGWRYM